MSQELTSYGIQIHGGMGFRITSYNVCYTKLLRLALEQLLEAARKAVLREGLQVHSRAEATARTRQHSRGEASIGVELLDGGEQSLRERGIDRVSYNFV